MVYEFLIGETYFVIQTSQAINWRPEEERFYYNGQPYRQRIDVSICFVIELPNIMISEQYSFTGLRIGRDADENEVRRYEAAFLPDRPDYALSVLRGNEITVYFWDRKHLWNNPNIRIWNMLHMERVLLCVDALVLHCSYVVHNGRAILFSAPSGAGKTTQAKLWVKNAGAQIVNGDKAIVQKRGNRWYACGYPFHGSSAECLNQDWPIEVVTVVRQNDADFIEELSMLNKIKNIYSEVTNNSWDKSAVDNTLALVEMFCTDVNVICQKCTMRDDAYFTLNQYLEEKRNGTI